MTFKGEKLEFIKGERLDGGGNGDVYHIICNPPSERPLVAKFLRIGGRFDTKRYERFKREVKTVLVLGDKYQGILPIIDHSLPEEPSRENPPWYAMSLAVPLKKYLFNRNATIIEKMKVIKDIGEGLRNIHNEGFSHRDIKLDNLLIYNDRIVISDFGLVAHHNLERLTTMHEKVGPWTTIAPEMRFSAYEIQDARPADIYSFAKLVWIILMEDENGFDGQYGKEKIFGLKCSEFGVETLECIHQTLMDSTDSDITKRQTIDEVLMVLEQWHRIIGDEMLLAEDKRRVVKSEIKNEFTPSMEYFEDINTVIGIIEKIYKLYSIKSEQFQEIIPRSCKRSRLKNCLEISDGLNTYLFKPVKLTIENRIVHGTDLEQWYLLEIETIGEEEFSHIKDRFVRYEDVDFLDSLLTGRIDLNPPIIVLRAEKEIQFV
ncbi:protein kinase domain-containing protein [Paenibacillus agricola]|uniref:Protein kinase n=1 Tax=Paenibacillus agricola TaxID=2716264 RepID=A0ABX0J8V5_9BACL|nr:protein kinase [Paenibacillus agricola]NHN31624.1 protein kinase [Paenibacillus agricola]